MDQPTREPQPKPKIAKWLLIALVIVATAAIGFFSWYYLSGPGKKAETKTTTSKTTSTPKTATSTTAPTSNNETTQTNTSQTPSNSSTTTEQPTSEANNPSSELKTFTSTSDTPIISFQYPGNLYAGKINNGVASWTVGIADQETCLTKSDTSGCKIVNIYFALSGSGSISATEAEDKLKTNSDVTKSTITSGAITIRTYQASDRYEAYFDTDCNGVGSEGSRYHVFSNDNSAETISLMKQILGTISVPTHCQ